MVSFRPISFSSGLLGGALLALAVVTSATVPAAAQSNANFGSVTLGSGTRTLSGYTQGSTPLSTIARAGAQGNHCVGYGETEPDHIVVLSNPVSSITLAVDSGGNDTTLLVRSAQNRTVFCSDDSNNADAALRGQGWEAGTYQVWVGSFDPNTRFDYQLTVRSNP
ncbi:MAG: hypothetical protein ACFB4J_16345 [Elainellaceae cyanobacterium]